MKNVFKILICLFISVLSVIIFTACDEDEPSRNDNGSHQSIEQSTHDWSGVYKLRTSGTSDQHTAPLSEFVYLYVKKITDTTYYFCFGQTWHPENPIWNDPTIFDVKSDGSFDGYCACTILTVDDRPTKETRISGKFAGPQQEDEDLGEWGWVGNGRWFYIIEDGKIYEDFTFKRNFGGAMGLSDWRWITYTDITFTGIQQDLDGWNLPSF